MRAFGTVEPVIYFERSDGHVMLAPYSEMRAPFPYIRMEAGTLGEIDRLVERMKQQELRQMRQESESEEVKVEAAHNIVRDRMRQRLASSQTPQKEKDFIREYLNLMEVKRVARLNKRGKADFFLAARENDLHGRGAGEEVWNG